ncbi:MAG: DHH family phosphoesterase [bacterium]
MTDAVWTPVRALLDRHRRVLVTTHLGPDADAIGSEIAFAEILRAMGKEVALWNASPTPRNCAFLDPAREIRAWSGPDAAVLAWADLAVILDVNAWSNLGEVGDAIRASSLPRLLIDHHRGGDDDIAETRVSDVTAAATGVLIFEMARAFGQPITPRAATPLYAALCGDTGSFRFANTDARALHVAADLVAAGALPDDIYRALFEDLSWERLRLLPHALGSLRAGADGKLAWLGITHAMFRDAGAIEEDADRFVDQIRGLRGVEVCAVFRELESGDVKVSLRSSGRVDVQRVAVQFGGGGHRLAAGAHLPGPYADATAKVVAALEAGVRSGGA